MQYRWTLLSTLLLVAGCAHVPPDAGFDAVQQTVAARLDERIVWQRGGKEDAEVAAHVDALLAQPLTVDAAVQVALLHHRGLQAEYEQLGVAQADLVQAGLLKNPTLGWSRLSGGDIAKTTTGLELDFLGLLLARPRKAIAALQFEHMQLNVSQAVLRHALDTRKAWLEAVSAEQMVRFLSQVADLTGAEAELAERQRRAGNLSRRDAMRQQAFDLETDAALEQARSEAVMARERLARLMGVDAPQWRLPEQLPGLPSALPLPGDLEADGLAQRLDVAMARKEVEVLAKALQLTRDTRLVNVLDLGVETEKGSGERRITGPTLSLELPLFDQGQARLAAHEARYRQGQARLAALSTEARSQMREARQRMEMAYRQSRRFQDHLVPLRRSIVEQSTLHYNGMLIGVYELLADAREQIRAVQGHIDATRDFWIAVADLQLAVGGRLPEVYHLVAEPPASRPSDDDAAPQHTHGGHAP